MSTSARPSPVRRAYDATWGRLFASLYDRSMAAGERGELGARREEIVGRARGRVLELGAGTGLNLSRYGPEVSSLVLTEPFEPMAKRLRERVAAPGHPPAEVVETPAEQLPFEDATFDSVVATLVLCTVADPARTLGEVARVLKPGGRMFFIEHVRAETPGLVRAQNVLHGPWYFVGHGCHTQPRYGGDDPLLAARARRPRARRDRRGTADRQADDLGLGAAAGRGRIRLRAGPRRRPR